MEAPLVLPQRALGHAERRLSRRCDVFPIANVREETLQNRVEMNSQQIMDEYNQAAFASKLARKRFTAYGNLFEAERIILDKLRPSLKDRKLLDIGIGGGRTTRFLLEISRDYTGIDY